MAGLIIGDIEVTDPVRYEEYKRRPLERPLAGRTDFGVEAARGEIAVQLQGADGREGGEAVQKLLESARSPPWKLRRSNANAAPADAPTSRA